MYMYSIDVLRSIKTCLIKAPCLNCTIAIFIHEFHLPFKTLQNIYILFIFLHLIGESCQVLLYLDNQ